MITSYGSDESDSDTTDDNLLKNNTSSIIESKNIDSVKLKCNEKYSLSLPLMQSQLISQNINHKYEEKDNMEESVTELLDLKSIEGTEMKYLKNQIKQQNVVQRINECVDKLNDNRFIMKSITKKNNSKHNVNSDVDFRISLVPGYDEDSDVEEEVKQEKKVLFPIPQIDEITENVSSYKSTLDDQIVNNNDDINIERKNILEQNNEDVLEKLEYRDDSETKSEEDIQKGNKFIDNLHNRNKYFQRKKRIAFDGKNIL